MPKNLYAGIFKWLWAVLPGQKKLYIFKEKKYDFQIVCFKIVESAPMPELNKDIFLKTRGGLLRTEDILLKT